MSTIELCIGRLISGKALLKTIGGAADFAANVESAPKQLPAAFLVPWAWTPGANQLDTMMAEQQVKESVAVFIAVSNLKDATGRAALDSLEPIRAEVRGLLFGWSPSAGYDPMTMGPGKLFKVLNNVLWWMDVYNTSSIWRSA